MKKKVQKEDAPATQSDIGLLRNDLHHDLELVGGNLAFQIDELRQETNERFDRHESILESILNVVTSISGQLAEMMKIPQKVERHEKRITDVEIQVRMLQK